jgi:hypothetical protein
MLTPDRCLTSTDGLHRALREPIRCASLHTAQDIGRLIKQLAAGTPHDEPHPTTMSSVILLVVFLSMSTTTTAQEVSLSCDDPVEHVSLLASCGKIAMKYDKAGEKFTPVPNSAMTACGNQIANRNVAVCSTLPEAAGKFSAGSITLAIFNFGWFWACTDVGRSQNCSQVKGVYVDCWFSSVATPRASLFAFFCFCRLCGVFFCQRFFFFFFFFFPHTTQQRTANRRVRFRQQNQLVSIFNQVCLDCRQMSPQIIARRALACQHPACIVPAVQCLSDVTIWL